MTDSDQDSPEGQVSSGGAASAAPSRPQQAPIGGMVRDPREIKTNPSLTRFLRERMSAAIVSGLVSIGVLRPRTPSGELGPRSWKGLFTFLGTVLAIIIVWTSVQVVQPGNVGVPVTFGHPSKPLGAGLHLTLPFTTAYSLSTRTQNYTMSSNKSEGQNGNTDSAVSVLGGDGGAATVNATVLFRLDPKRATDVYRNLGTNYQKSIVRPSARSCIRLVFTHHSSVVTAATSAWSTVESEVGHCMKDKLVPQGLLLADFQLREVTLDPKVAAAVNLKVASQQTEEQQKFEQATALQQADITRIQALATADSQQILACGGVKQTVVRDGAQVSIVVPNPLTRCTQSQFTTAYLQFTYIQALKQLATSQTNTTLVLPFDKNLTPLLNVGGASSGTVTTPTAGG